MESTSLTETIAALLDRAAYPKNMHYALAALQDVRAQFGHVPSEAVPVIADRMGMEPAAVVALMRDSAQFPEKSTAAHQLSICQGAVCIGRGGGELLKQARRLYGDRPGLQVVAGYCLGHCVQAPSASLDGRITAPVDAESLRRMVGILTD